LIGIISYLSNCAKEPLFSRELANKWFWFIIKFDVKTRNTVTKHIT